MRVGTFFLSALVFLGPLGASLAHAVSLSERGGTAYLSGPIEPGDDTALRAFLDRPRATPIRVLYLSSFGGHVGSAIAMSRLVRNARLSTAMNATSDVCDSACTLIFAGGIKRHYVKGERIYEGLTGLSGLGFHPAHARGAGVAPSLRSDEGTSRMARAYAEMGQPRAIELARQAAINTLYRPSGETALRLNIATSLAAPIER